MPTVRFIVSGKVQGVFFRASARERALALGLAGHALNLDDGRVEVLASGNLEAIESLQQWLHSGPSTARFERVFREHVAEQDLLGFITG